MRYILPKLLFLGFLTLLACNKEEENLITASIFGTWETIHIEVSTLNINGQEYDISFLDPLDFGLTGEIPEDGTVVLNEDFTYEAYDQDGTQLRTGTFLIEDEVNVIFNNEFQMKIRRLNEEYAYLQTDVDDVYEYQSTTYNIVADVKFVMKRL